MIKPIRHLTGQTIDSVDIKKYRQTNDFMFKKITRNNASNKDHIDVKTNENSLTMESWLLRITNIVYKTCASVEMTTSCTHI